MKDIVDCLLDIFEATDSSVWSIDKQKIIKAKRKLTRIEYNTLFKDPKIKKYFINKFFNALEFIKNFEN